LFRITFPPDNIANPWHAIFIIPSVGSDLALFDLEKASVLLWMGSTDQYAKDDATIRVLLKKSGIQERVEEITIKSVLQSFFILLHPHVR
jgi:hypothetical protein